MGDCPHFIPFYRLAAPGHPAKLVNVKTPDPFKPFKPEFPGKPRIHVEKCSGVSESAASSAERDPFDGRSCLPAGS